MWSSRSNRQERSGAGSGLGARRLKLANRKWFKRLGLLAGLASGLVLATAWLLLSEPDFYRQAYAEGSHAGSQSARKFVAQMANLYNGVENRGRWDATVSQRSVNAWLANDGAGQVRAALPEWLSDPRVVFKPERLLLGLRCRFGPFRTVLSVRARLWAPQPETIAVQVEGVRVGRLPLPKRTLAAWARQVAEAARVHIEWRSYEGNPVAIIRPAQPEGFRLAITELTLADGSLRVLGAAQSRSRAGQPLLLPPLPDSAGRNAAVHDPPAVRLR